MKLVRALIRLILKKPLRALIAFYNNESLRFRNGSGSTVLELLRNKYVEESSRFIAENIESALIFDSRDQLWQYAKKIYDGMSEEFGKSDVGLLEFGVYQGESLRFFAELLEPKIVYGFDSFAGLEEDWTGSNEIQGHFNLGKDIPKFTQSNIRLVIGKFQATLDNFLNQNRNKFENTSLLVHIDSDTYVPAEYVLSRIKNLGIKLNLIVIFDEFHGYPNWKMHEYRALTSTFSPDEYRYRAFSNSQAIVEVKLFA